MKRGNTSDLSGLLKGEATNLDVNLPLSASFPIPALHTRYTCCFRTHLCWRLVLVTPFLEHMQGWFRRWVWTTNLSLMEETHMSWGSHSLMSHSCSLWDQNFRVTWHFAFFPLRGNCFDDVPIFFGLFCTGKHGRKTFLTTQTSPVLNHWPFCARASGARCQCRN